MEVQFSNYECIVKKSTYSDSNRTRIDLIDKNDGMPVATATVNFPKIPLEENEIIIKNYAENVGIYEALVKAGVISEVKKIMLLTFVSIHICELLNFE